MNITAMVSEYNGIEQEQQARLREIFAAVKARKGYRHVKITGEMWSNCWDLPDALDHQFTDKMQRVIYEVVPGAERAEPRPPDEPRFVKGERAETMQ